MRSSIFALCLVFITAAMVDAGPLRGGRHSSGGCSAGQCSGGSCGGGGSAPLPTGATLTPDGLLQFSGGKVGEPPVYPAREVIVEAGSVSVHVAAGGRRGSRHSERGGRFFRGRGGRRGGR